MGFGTSLSLSFWKIYFTDLLQMKKKSDFCQWLSLGCLFPYLQFPLAAEETKPEICYLNHQGSVGDCCALQHSLSSWGLDFSLHNSDPLGKKINTDKQTWIWSIPVAGVYSSVSPSSTRVTEPHRNNHKELMFLKLYPRANPCSFTGVSGGLSKS